MFLRLIVCDMKFPEYFEPVDDASTQNATDDKYPPADFANRHRHPHLLQGDHPVVSMQQIERIIPQIDDSTFSWNDVGLALNILKTAAHVYNDAVSS